MRVQRQLNHICTFKSGFFQLKVELAAIDSDLCVADSDTHIDEGKLVRACGMSACVIVWV